MEYSERIRHCQPKLWLKVDELRRTALERLWPSVCTLCRGRGQPALDLCAACEADLPLNSTPCARCAQPLAAGEALTCGACLRRPPPFASAFAPFRYAYPIDHLVRGLKYRDELSRGRVLGELLARALRTQHAAARPQVLIPTPLSARRYRERGFNQAAELARTVSTRLHIPVRCDLAQRVRDTREQAGLDRKARRRNVRGAFVCAPLPMHHVAIVDDVMTTGSTVRELARVLRRAGAQDIEVWTVARTRET